MDVPNSDIFNGMAMSLNVGVEGFSSHKFSFLSIIPQMVSSYKIVLHHKYKLFLGINVGLNYAIISKAQLEKLKYYYDNDEKVWVLMKLDARLTINNLWDIGAQYGLLNTMTGIMHYDNNPKMINLYVGFHFKRIRLL
jgi:hypothetical protein